MGAADHHSTAALLCLCDVLLTLSIPLPDPGVLIAKLATTPLHQPLRNSALTSAVLVLLMVSGCNYL